ncbi:MAG: shikimate kinase [Synergistaceae bacterium]|jgi:shikimate kinase|nr:shikimate kinase [Synergistaceae bacterium]
MMKHMALVGLSGSGKTTLGGLLAEKLGLPFVDLDREAERRAGMTVKDIFKRHGEEFFRVLESDTTREVLESPAPSVVATGGGVVLRSGNVEVLRENALVVFLNRPVEHIMNDVPCDGSRPLLTKAGRLQEMERERRPLYLDAADATLLNDAGIVEAMEKLLNLASTRWELLNHLL